MDRPIEGVPVFEQLRPLVVSEGSVTHLHTAAPPIVEGREVDLSWSMTSRIVAELEHESTRALVELHPEGIPCHGPRIGTNGRLERPAPRIEVGRIRLLVA
jgi:hypothetical protein